MKVAPRLACSSGFSDLDQDTIVSDTGPEMDE